MESRYGRAAILLILAATAFHFAYSTRLELVGDEAYYWLWSRRLDICYLDKGPMIAWLIRAGTTLFGQTVFGVRFFAVLLAAGTGAGLYLLGKELFSARVGFWAVVLATLAPLFAVGATLMTIDTIYVFFWTWAAWTFWRAKDSTGLRLWLLTGALVGCGLLSKYTAAIEVVSFAAFCCFHPPSRAHFRRGTFWSMICVALLFLGPAIVWNTRHHWPTSDWLLQRGALNQRFSLHPADVLVFLGEQAGVLSPLFFLGLLYLLCQPSLLQIARPTTAYAVALFFPLFGLYLALSFHYSGSPNWTAAAYIGGLILLAAKWTELAAIYPWARWATVAAIVLAAIETTTLHETRWLHLPANVDPLDRARGSRTLAASVAEAERQTGARFVIADNYMTAALLSFYLPGQPETFVPITTRPLNQMELWPTYDQRYPAGDALIVASHARLTHSLHKSFARLTPLRSVDVTDAGRKVGRYYFFLAQRDQRAVR